MPAELSSPSYPVQFQGMPRLRAALQWLGWTVHFDGLPTPQGLFAVYPHTSNWDFVLLVITKWALGVPVMFWGKDKLFHVPLLGAWMRSLGGVPVDRTAPHGVVQQAVRQFEAARKQGRYFWLALSPEGTRKRIDGWRSGFYRTALQADVPICLVRLDYRKREVWIRDFIYLSGDETEDFARIAKIYDGVTGRNAGNASPIRLLAPTVPRRETIVK